MRKNHCIVLNEGVEEIRQSVDNGRPVYTEIKNDEYRILVRNYYISMGPNSGYNNHWGVEMNLWIYGVPQMFFLNYDPVCKLVDVCSEQIPFRKDLLSKEDTKKNLQLIEDWFVTIAEQNGVQHLGDIYKAMSGSFGIRVANLLRDYAEGKY